MKHRSIARNALFGAMTFALAQPALAVTDEEFRELQEQFNMLVEQVEANSSVSSDTTIGGYGELHYNNLRNGEGKNKKEMDFHRFVLFVDHQFNDKIRFFSELEVEHGTIADTDTDTAAGSKTSPSPGSVAIEQAYVQFDLGAHTRANAGILLVPVGFINETHEPPTFYGVERNIINKYIIPTTWREGGAGLSGNYDTGFSYDLILHTGLDGGTSIRGGRQKVAEANASNLASTLRVKYTGIVGLEIAGTLQYQDDMTQNTSDEIGSASLLEGHVRWSVADVTLTALYAQWNIDVASTASAENRAKDVQNGGYLEASYKITPKWGVFVRQNGWDNGGSGNTARTQTDFGFNYWPHEDVVIKADYQIQNNYQEFDSTSGTIKNVAGFDGLNLGVGYQF